MKKAGLLLLGMLWWVMVDAQNITFVEYFFDTDPGFGNGVSVSITPAVSISGFSFSADITSLSSGFHTLYIRAKDANGNWSMPYSRPFYKVSLPAALSNVDKLEYFFDVDPGFGNGVSVSITPAVSIPGFSFSADITSLSTGFHTLYVRGKDANGNWSLPYSRPFYKVTVPVALSNVDKLEYFFDADPGFGSGTNVPITAGTSIANLAVTVPVTGLSESSHKLTFRARDTSGNWSIVAIKTIGVCNHPTTTVSAASSVTSGGFNVSWQDVPGSIGYELDVSTDNFATLVSGYSAKSITAPTLSTNVTGLAQAATYQFRVRAVASCASVNSNTMTVTTLATPPIAQPTNLLFSSVTTSSMTAFFTAPASPPSGYLVIRSAVSPPTFVPSNNTTYVLGQTVGNGIVAYKGSSTLFNEAGLAPNTNYYYSIFAYNQFNGAISYLINSPLQNNVRTNAVEPSAQPTSLQFSAVTDNSLSISFTPAPGVPDGYLVLRKVGSAPTQVPVDGVTYTTSVGVDAIAYQGSAASFSETGLSQNTVYYYSVFAFNGVGSSINYRTSLPLQGSQLTLLSPPADSPSSLTFSNVTPTSITLSFSAALSAPSGYLVVRQANSNPNFVPQPNVAYTVGQSVLGATVVYTGPNLTLTDNGLSASTNYYYDIFSYNTAGASIAYRSPPVEGNQTTFTAEPSTQPTSITFSTVTASSLIVSFAPAAPNPAGYLVLRKAGLPPSSTPVDGVAYAVGSTLGDATVASVGASTSFSDTGLLAGTVYFYVVFSFNGSGPATNYLSSTGSSNSGSKITLPAKPAVSAATSIEQDRFTINWSAVTGATGYVVDVSKDDFSTFFLQNFSVAGVSTTITGLESGIGYKYRLRAINESGASVNSDPVIQYTVPATPILSASTLVEQTTFTANWTAVTGAVNYYLDVSTVSDFSTLQSGYNNKSLGNIISTTVSGLSAGTIYYYRVRAENPGGASPYSSPIGSQLLIPATPVGIDQPNATTNSFKAKWEPATGAASYLLDVSLTSNDFNPSLGTYTDKPITGSMEELVTSLIPNTAYKFRVRAKNASGVSPYSIPIIVSTLNTSGPAALQLSNPVFSPLFSTGSSVSVQVSGGTLPYLVLFNYRKITERDFTFRTLTATGNSTYAIPIDASMLDEIGLEFYLNVTDADGATRESSTHGFIYRSFAAGEISIPNLSFGGKLKDYTIFSIPYAVTDNNISNIFDELGKYEKSKWRLVRYLGGKYVDYTEGLTKIEMGKGYWFNALTKIDVTISEGSAPQFNQTTPFKLKLEKEWNQIGNPFPFGVDWSDVIEANPQHASKVDQSILVFEGSQQRFVESDVLNPWSGGFVFANEAVELTFPVTLKNSFSGGRENQSEWDDPNLEEGNWFLPITLTQGTVSNGYGGVGMRQGASYSKDVFDKHTLPRFGSYLEWNTYHDDFFHPWFARDVVPSTNHYVWTFTAESNQHQGDAELSWDPASLGNGDGQLMLIDAQNSELIDMKRFSSYRFDLGKPKTFKILYGAEKSLLPDLTLVGHPYPNPFLDVTTIPIVVGEKLPVEVVIYDLTGRKVIDLVKAIYEPGVHTVAWNRLDQSGHIVPAGMYLSRVLVGGKEISTVRKIIAK